MSQQCPIAIVAAGAIFPGSVGVRGFWQNILAKKDLVSDTPPGHWRIDDYYDPDPKSPDKTYAKRGAFLPDVPFDAMGFGIPPTILPATDTSQLLALIVAKMTLEDIGRDTDLSKTSVILGVTGAQELLGSLVSRLQRPVWERALRGMGLSEEKVEEACKRIADHYVGWQESSFPGLLGNVVAGRIANRLNTGGTNCITDAACASALSAVHMAMLELWAGTSDMVVTGGVDTMNDIFMYMCFSKTPALSMTGDCRPFDESADGTLLGEGIGMVALKRLDDAERDGDHVYCVIRGLGQSSDGRSKSVYAPVPDGQAVALRRCYEQAGYAPETVELMEAHGTATKAGDKAELEGLQMVFAPGDKKQWCALGSIKSQIGHTKATAGAAGLLKIALALHHKTLPPTIKVKHPRSDVDWPNSAFYVNTESRPWVRGPDHPRRASVSSFGFGGSNFHVAAEEYLGENRPARMDPWEAELVAFSAGTKEELLAMIAEAHGKHADELAVRTQRTFDPAEPARVAIVVKGDLNEKLKKAAEAITTQKESSRGDVFYSPVAHEGGVALLFPGQGSQSLDMGASLLRFDEVRAAVDAAEAAVPGLGRVMYPIPAFTPEARAEQDALLTRTDWAQPALGALSAGVLALVRELGLTAESAAGHSFGEVVALYSAGAVDFATMMAMARKRGELMHAASAVPGAMAAVLAAAEAIRPHLGDDVVIANHNAPEQTVIAGATGAVIAAMGRLEAAGLRCTRIPVGTAFHSPIVAPAGEQFTAWLREQVIGTPTMPVYRNTTAAPHDDGIAVALGEHLRSPVRFVEQIEAMYAAGTRTFVEMGPGNVLTGLVGRILKGRPHVAVSLDAKGRDPLEALLAGVARLVAIGLPLTLAPLARHRAPGAGDLVAAKGAVMINGANYGKPYPRDDSKPVLPNVKQPAAPPEEEMSKPLPPVVIPEPAPVHAPMVVPAPVAPAPAGNAWITAFQEGQRQLAEVHDSFQRSMADAHIAFLKSQDEANRTLAAMLGGHAAVPAPTVIAAATQVVMPAPVVMPPSAPSGHLPPPSRGEEGTTGNLPPPDIRALLMDVVAEKTGYPAGMLNLEMNLEADLGIDSIKRVEILSAMREKAPHLPEPDAETMGRLATLGAIVELLQPPSAPSGHLPPPSRGEEGTTRHLPAPDVRALLMDVVAEKTGYPAGMLNLEMNLEADLGIDSIKRVEILSAMREKAPHLPEPDAETMGRLATLGAIVELLGGAPVPAPVGHDVRALLMEVVAEKTGYPAGMLNLEMNLEADLGIDSIKRVEILSAMREKAPHLPEPDAETMGRLATLGAIVELLQPPSAPSGHLPPQMAPPPAPPPSGLHRYDLALVPVPAGSRVTLGPVAVLGDDAEALATALRSRGLDASTTAAADRGVIWLSGTGETSVRGAFQAARAGKLGTFVTVARMGGDFGLSGAADPVLAGLSGLVKTAALEHPACHARAVDAGDASIDAIADEIVQSGPTEVALRGTERLTLRSVDVPTPHTAPTLGATDVVVVSGGARGVTAACVFALANATRASFVLLGRSQIDHAEPVEAAAVADEAGLKKALAPKASSPAQLGRQVSAILAAREARANIAAIEAAGSRVRYLAVDVQDTAALTAALAAVRAEWGPITGLVHGAGVLHDKRLKDKTDAQFDAVWTTKVHGLRALLAAIGDDPLRVLCVFSSVAARTGNVGQADYAAANEALNKLAAAEAARRPGCVVKSIGWGPWEGGMVTPALAKQFAAMGVSLIPLADGAQAFVDEISAPGSVELVIGGLLPTANDAPSIRRVHARDYPFLRDHTVADTPVFPVVLALEWFAQLARESAPDKHVVAIRDLKVLKGISLGGFDGDGDLFEVISTPKGTGLALELRSPNGAVHYRAHVELSDTPPLAPAAPRAGALADYPHAPEEIYRRYLFHGPDFQVIQKVVGVGDDAAEAQLTGTADIGWSTNGWLTDMAAGDGGLQLAVLWSRRYLNAASLPTGIGAYKSYGRPAAGPVRSVLKGVKRDTRRSVSDIAFVDCTGRVFAEMEAVELHALPGGEYPRNAVA